MQIVEGSINNRSLLTIAIPTYNRASYLDLCLKRLGEEIAGLSEDRRCLVKIYISDNASLDNTPQIIAQYQALNPDGIKAVRNSINSGADHNIAQCYGSATSPYVWVLGDDDVILSGRLGMVLDVLLKQEIDILYVNNYWFIDDYKEKPVHHKKQGVAKFGAPLEFARRTNVMLTFISALIVRSGVGLELRNGLLASNLVQLSWVLPLLRDGKCFAVIEDIVVAAQGSNSGGYELVKVFGNNLKKITDSMLEGKPELARAIQNGAIVNFFPGFILEFRQGLAQFADKNMADGLAEAFVGNWRYYVFLLPLIFLPLSIARFYNVPLKVFRRLFRPILL